MLGQPWVIDADHGRVPGQRGGEHRRGRARPPDPQRQRLQAAAQQERLIGRERAAGVDPDAADVADQLDAPGDHAAGDVGVTADVLGRGVDDQVGAVLQGTADHRRGQGGVDHQQRPAVVRDLGQLVQVGHGRGRVGDGLRVDDPGRRADRGLDLVQVGDVHEVRLHPEPGRHVAQERVGAAVQRGGRDHVRPGPGKGPEHPADRGHPRGERLSRGPPRQVDPLQRGDRPGERVDRRVVDPAVGVAGHLVVQDGAVFLRAAERERRGAVHRRAERLLRRRRRGREMHRPRVLPGLLAHYVHDPLLTARTGLADRDASIGTGAQGPGPARPGPGPEHHRPGPEHHRPFGPKQKDGRLRRDPRAPRAASPA